MGKGLALPKVYTVSRCIQFFCFLYPLTTKFGYFGMCFLANSNTGIWKPARPFRERDNVFFHSPHVCHLQIFYLSTFIGSDIPGLFDELFLSGHVVTPSLPQLFRRHETPIAGLESWSLELFKMSFSTTGLTDHFGWISLGNFFSQVTITEQIWGRKLHLRVQ